MTTLELQQLKDILAGNKWEVVGRLMSFVGLAKVTEDAVKEQRTSHEADKQMMSTREDPDFAQYYQNEDVEVRGLD